MMGFIVIPAQAGIQNLKLQHYSWIPAYAGMTVYFDYVDAIQV
jgi:hypothetical protein